MDEQEKKRKLLNYVKALVAIEQELRQQHGIGDNYRSITNRLKSLHEYIEQHTDLADSDLDSATQHHNQLLDHEQYVYVYLFNTHGRLLSRWVAMLTPRSFSEYSVNRPIYQEQNQVEAYIRSRPNTDEHAYIIMKVNKADITSSQHDTFYHDAIGQPLLKLKERSLREENLVSFVYQGNYYRLNKGQLILDKAAD